MYLSKPTRKSEYPDFLEKNCREICDFDSEQLERLKDLKLKIKAVYKSSKEISGFDDNVKTLIFSKESENIIRNAESFYHFDLYVYARTLGYEIPKEQERMKLELKRLGLSESGAPLN